MKVLVEADILKYEKKGRNIIYSIKNREIECLLRSLGIRDVKPCCCFSVVAENRAGNLIDEEIEDRAESEAKDKSKVNLQAKKK
ncbi:transcriptional regulator, ArsR family [Methanosarcina mazei Tuc01]|uniref:Transcriptional regulator, ArsR family n=1 Tax=Methanosarcina mazei Tuc01 TaxID=1236903 RepID=M1PV28_METMZ|nr:transcriptional regulator, ArsR family [Methanosarcina mazei Tuc01]